MHIIPNYRVPQFVLVQVQLLVDEVVENFVASLDRETRNGLIVANIELSSEVTIDQE